MSLIQGKRFKNMAFLVRQCKVHMALWWNAQPAAILFLSEGLANYCNTRVTVIYNLTLCEMLQSLTCYSVLVTYPYMKLRHVTFCVWRCESCKLTEIFCDGTPYTGFGLTHCVTCICCDWTDLTTCSVTSDATLFTYCYLRHVQFCPHLLHHLNWTWWASHHT